jgi:two-component system, LytTR family, sensor kinase
MKKSLEVISNFVFWIIITYLFYYDYVTRLGMSFDKNFGMFHIPNLVFVLFFSLLGPSVIFYLFYFIFVPRLLVTKKYLFFTIFAIISSILVGYSFRLTIGGNAAPLSKFMYLTTMALLWGIVGGAIKGVFLWINSVAERKELEKRHLENKNALLLLQSQINPHFLFNSLNNIDILIKDTPEVASEYLKKLSDILRYVLYETKEDETDLEKEITQIKSYIDLQKIRTDNPHYVNFKVTGELKDQKVAPMIFIPFIENAFKHSKNKTIENAIDIEFDIQGNNIKMVCRNYFEANHLEVLPREGIGNETVKRRLSLLYPDNHELDIKKTQNWFTVRITLNSKDGN